jgi:hypothetical protein
MRAALRKRAHRTTATVSRPHVDPRTLCADLSCSRVATSGVAGWRLCTEHRAERGL